MENKQLSVEERLYNIMITLKKANDLNEKAMEKNREAMETISKLTHRISKKCKVNLPAPKPATAKTVPFVADYSTMLNCLN